VGFHRTRPGIFELFSSSLGASIRRREIQIRGIPHLAKNERDMGHPSLWAGRILKPQVLTHALEAPRAGLRKTDLRGCFAAHTPSGGSGLALND